MWWLKQSDVLPSGSITEHFFLLSAAKPPTRNKSAHLYVTAAQEELCLPPPVPCRLKLIADIVFIVVSFLRGVLRTDQVGGWHCLVWEVFCRSRSNRLLETGVDSVANGNRCCSANNVGRCKHEPRLWAPASNWTSVCVFPLIEPRYSKICQWQTFKSAL